jgi:small-conductance mechanosensitive channel
MELLAWMMDLQKLSYGNEINFIVYVALLVFFRSVLLKLGQIFVSKRGLEGSDLFPFIKSIINWGTFYGLLLFIIVYFPEEKWLTTKFPIAGKASFSVFSVIIATIIITLGFRLSQFFSRFVLKPTFQRYHLDSGVQYTFIRISHYLIIIIAALLSVANIGIDLSALTVFVSILGVGIGFGLQNIASNFISGIILLFERPFKVGDVVKVADILCVVEEIKMRATVVTTYDNERIIIPNSQFVENQIVNWSYGDERMRVVVPIGVAYGSNVKLLEELLLKAAYEQDVVLADPQPNVDFLAFGASSLDFRLVVWVPSPNDRLRTLSNLNYRINELFQEYGLEIPFQQQDLHLRSIDPKLVGELKRLVKE